MSYRTLSLTLSLPALLSASVAWAQGGQPDFSAVQIKVHPVAGNFYYLEGQGGNVGVLVGDDGVLMIDDQFAPLTEKLVAAIRTISNKPIKMLVNTHVHGDHTGGNANVGGMGVEIIAHDNVRVRLAKGVNGGAAAPAAALPVITYGDTIALHLNGEDIEIAKLPPAHTDGDSYVRFPKADVIHVGDVFRTVGYPGVDAGNGGIALITAAGAIRVADDDSAADACALALASRSVWIGQLPSTTKPAWMIADTSVSHASGCLCADRIRSLVSKRMPATGVRS